VRIEQKIQSQTAIKKTNDGSATKKEEELEDMHMHGSGWRMRGREKSQ
jgi:hypothetical protein